MVEFLVWCVIIAVAVSVGMLILQLVFVVIGLTIAAIIGIGSVVLGFFKKD